MLFPTLQPSSYNTYSFNYNDCVENWVANSWASAPATEFFLVLIKSKHEIQHVLKSYLSLKRDIPQKTCISRAFPWPVLCLEKRTTRTEQECELWDEQGQPIVLFLCDIVARQKSERPFSSLHSELNWQVAGTEGKGLSKIQWWPHWS